jgi:hypothetical protein
MQPASVPHRIGLLLAAVQFLFALTWTVYVIFLPALLAQAGIAKSALLPILLADQLIFVAMDFTFGVTADRVARTVGRLGRAIVIVTGVSAAALLLLPWIAPRRVTWLFFGLTAVWAVTSSALRAPPLKLLGKHAARPALPWLASLTLLGLGLSSAIAPYLTLRLRELDPRWPFALSSIALVAATFAIVHVERSVAAGRPPAEWPTTSEAEPAGGRHVVAFLCAVALVAVASQLHQFLNSPALYLRYAAPADLPRLGPVFWIGFNLLLLPAGAATRRYGGLLVMTVGGIVAALASSFALLAGSLAELVAIQAVAGGAWACVLASAIAAALDIGHTGREGRVTGALFSMLALAAVARIAIVAAELAKEPAYPPWLQWAPVAAWTAGSAVLLLQLASRRAGLFWRRAGT